MPRATAVCFVLTLALGAHPSGAEPAPAPQKGERQRLTPSRYHGLVIERRQTVIREMSGLYIRLFGRDQRGEIGGRSARDYFEDVLRDRRVHDFASAAAGLRVPIAPVPPAPPIPNFDAPIHFGCPECMAAVQSSYDSCMSSAVSSTVAACGGTADSWDVANDNVSPGENQVIHRDGVTGMNDCADQHYNNNQANQSTQDACSRGLGAGRTACGCGNDFADVFNDVLLRDYLALLDEIMGQLDEIIRQNTNVFDTRDELTGVANQYVELFGKLATMAPPVDAAFFR